MVLDLTSEEQHKLFKIGDTVTIRPDAQKYTLGWNNTMYEHLGKQGIIRNMVEYGKTKFLSYKKNDLAISVEIDNRCFEIYYWHYKSLISKRKLYPTYKPKKKTRRIL